MSEPSRPVSTDQLSTLQMLLNQQLSEYREIKDLREKLRAAEMRHQALADEIQRVLTALPVSGEAISLTPAGPAPASDDTQSAGRGFSAVDALVEHERKRAHNMEQFDRAVREGLQQLRASNPRFDEEWAT